MFHEREDKSGESWFERAGDRVWGDVDASAGSQGQVLAGDAPVAGPASAINDLNEEYRAEGLGAFIDPAGAADRLAARRELASRFNVMSDGTPGVAHQNQVSESEFEQIAREYSDIRLGRTDLQFGAKPANMAAGDYSAFKTNAMSDVADILQTESGRGLIDSLAHAPLQSDGKSHRITTMNPYLKPNGQFDQGNSGGGGNFGVSGHIETTPGMTTSPGLGDFRDDAVMYHELTHAHHAVYNTWDGDTVGSLNWMGRQFPYGTDPDSVNKIKESEYQAVGLGRHAGDRFSENRYRSERREIGRLGIGARTTGAESDAAMTHRDQYVVTPGLVRTHPAFSPP
ncbi:MAG: M91 family zinc metallopeptidase [Acidobacteriota bacterium]